MSCQQVVSGYMKFPYDSDGSIVPPDSQGSPGRDKGKTILCGEGIKNW